MNRTRVFLIIGFFFLCFCFITVRLHAESLNLVGNGTSRYVIVLGNDASSSEWHGARELQMFLQIISGAFLPILRESEPINVPMIFVGNSTAVQKVDPNTNYSSLGNDEYVIRTVPPHLILCGGRQRGSMYAVYDFLSRVLGCRWWSAKVSTIPKMPDIILKSLNIVEKPAFEHRDVYWTDAFDADWAARNRSTSPRAQLDIQRGGKINYLSVHTFYPLIPPDIWFDAHPEYFSLLYGKRQWEFAQLCLMNPELSKIMSMKVILWIERQPEGYIYCVSQNDWYNACTCEHCKLIDDREGSYSGTMVTFVNAVAERVEKVHPEKYIGTLAYQYTEKPPKTVKPRKNVVIRLCNIIGCDAHSLAECEQNIRFRNNLIGWAPIADKIHIWDYVTDFRFYLIPKPNWFAVQEDFGFFHSYGIDGIKPQGCMTTEGAAFAELEAYHQSQALWNPDRNAEDSIDEFVKNYYGPAAEPIREYIDLLQRKTADEWIHFPLNPPPTSAYLSSDIITRADQFFDQAERLARHNPDVAYRVEQLRLGVRYIKLAQPVEHILEGNLYKPVQNAPVYANLRELNKFMETVKKHNMRELGEARGLELPYFFLKANVSTHQVVSLENKHTKVDLIPGLGGRIYKMFDKKSGKNVFYSANTKDEGYPGAGGYEETTRGGKGVGYIEDFNYTISGGGSSPQICLQTYLNDRGYTEDLQRHNAHLITRVITLLPDRPGIEITTTLKALREIRNPSRIQTNPEFTFVNVGKTESGWLTAEGYALKKVFSSEDSLRARIEYRGKSISTGAWAAFNPEEKIGIVNIFEPSQVEYCEVRGDKSNNRLILSIGGIQKGMKAGDELKLNQKIMIIDDSSNMPIR